MWWSFGRIYIFQLLEMFMYIFDPFSAMGDYVTTDDRFWLDRSQLPSHEDLAWRESSYPQRGFEKGLESGFKGVNGRTILKGFGDREIFDLDLGSCETIMGAIVGEAFLKVAVPYDPQRVARRRLIRRSFWKEKLKRLL